MRHIEVSPGEFMQINKPLAENLDIVPIARALSREVRWNGLPETAITVAEHSCMVAHLYALRNPGDWAGALHALLHDAHEAYVRDLAHPIKSLIGPAYENIARNIQDQIESKFAAPVSDETKTEVRHIDICLCVEEKILVWGEEGIKEHYSDMPRFGEETRRYINYSFLSAEEAEGIFLDTYFNLRSLTFKPSKPKTIPRVIGFTGVKGSGKDTASACDLLADYSIESFADPIKDMLISHMAKMGMDRDKAEAIAYGDITAKETPLPELQGHTFRHAAQTLGTEWGRNCMGENYWVDCAKKVMDSPDEKFVITDVRFPNEVKTIRDMGGIVIRVNRNTEKNAASAHESEQHIANLDVDFDIHNNSTIAALHEQVRKVLSE